MGYHGRSKIVSMTETREQGYNGWANYETWCMALWIDNDEGSYNYARELVAGAVEAASADGFLEGQPASLREGYLNSHAADALKAWQEDEREAYEADKPASVFTDLLGAAFGEIDWWEIARNIRSEDA
jgi:hypothetical protein